MLKYLTTLYKIFLMKKDILIKSWAQRTLLTSLRDAAGQFGHQRSCLAFSAVQDFHYNMPTFLLNSKGLLVVDSHSEILNNYV